MRTRLLYQRLAALFVAGWLFFDFPLLSLWTRSGAGIALPLALFVGWAVLVGVLAWFLERGNADEGGHGDDGAAPPLEAPPGRKG